MGTVMESFTWKLKICRRKYLESDGSQRHKNRKEFHRDHKQFTEVQTGVGRCRQVQTGARSDEVTCFLELPSGGNFTLFKRLISAQNKPGCFCVVFIFYFPKRKRKSKSHVWIFPGPEKTSQKNNKTKGGEKVLKSTRFTLKSLKRSWFCLNERNELTEKHDGSEGKREKREKRRRKGGGQRS
ncbi:hypothetical protein NL108_006835 [Boleophthalmus pectinirostris]|nr:hypothetical protein NL108_006835 [Boleophthalmus pectinirostris]